MLNWLVYFAPMDRCLILQFSKAVGKIKDAISSALAVATVDDDNDEVMARSPLEVPRDCCSALQDTVVSPLTDLCTPHVYACHIFCLLF